MTQYHNTINDVTSENPGLAFLFTLLGIENSFCTLSERIICSVSDCSTLSLRLYQVSFKQIGSHLGNKWILLLLREKSEWEGEAAPNREMLNENLYTQNVDLYFIIWRSHFSVCALYEHKPYRDEAPEMKPERRRAFLVPVRCLTRERFLQPRRLTCQVGL